MGKIGKSSKARKQTFGHVVPLGGSCLIAKHLQNKGIRICKFPFDWMYSTPYLVRHALLDDFKTFLDTTKCQRGTGGESEEKCGTVHTVYRRMQSTKAKNVVFPHHQLWSGARNGRRDRSSYRRSVERLRRVLRSGTRTLFVAVLDAEAKHLEKLRDERWQPEGEGREGRAGRAGRGCRGCPVPPSGGPELCCRAEVSRLFECLKSKKKGPFHLEVVYLLKHSRQKGRKQVILQKSAKDRSLRITEMSCKGDHTGLAFREDGDMLAFHKLITDSSCRRFKPVVLDGNGTKGYRDVNGGSAASAASGASAASPSRSRELKRKLRFVQTNPKKKGTQAHVRYEVYKKAQTIQQFLDLGGFKGDLAFDQAHGFLTLS
ncbi:unnamed protein product [Symbiodinium sp. CCMP2456]|nr:unnamed protein product [Symbiodinium sp. CCMP2456]